MRWLSRASPSLSARMEHRTEDCEVRMCVSFCSCSRLMKWLSVEKPVETRAAEVAAVQAMRMHSKIGAWQFSGTLLCLMLDLRVLKSVRRDWTSVEGFWRALSRSDVSFSMMGTKRARWGEIDPIL